MLSIEIKIAGEQQEILLDGDLKGIEALDLRKKISSIIKESATSVIINLSQVVEMDLTGFNAIVIFKKELYQRNKKLYLVAPKDNIVHGYIHLSKLEFNYLQQVNK